MEYQRLLLEKQEKIVKMLQDDLASLTKAFDFDSVERLSFCLDANYRILQMLREDYAKMCFVGNIS